MIIAEDNNSHLQVIHKKVHKAHLLQGYYNAVKQQASYYHLAIPIPKEVQTDFIISRSVMEQVSG
jgi:hypothetical protein